MTYWLLLFRPGFLNHCLQFFFFNCARYDKLVTKTNIFLNLIYVTAVGATERNFYFRQKIINSPVDTGIAMFKALVQKWREMFMNGLAGAQLHEIGMLVQQMANPQPPHCELARKQVSGAMTVGAAQSTLAVPSSALTMFSSTAVSFLSFVFHLSGRLF